MSSPATTEAPPEIVQAAQGIIDLLPRKNWPEDSFSVARNWDLVTFCINGVRSAKLFFIAGAEGSRLANTWEDIK